MTGYIKDHRKELESDIWKMPPLYHRVWQFLKYKVNHESNRVPMSDGTVIEIKKGQHLTSVRKIARGVGYYEQGAWKEPNPRTIQRVLDWLIVNKMIEISTGHGNTKYTLVRLMQWEKYQSKSGEGNSEYTASTQQVQRNKNEKNDKEEKPLRSKLKFETHHMDLAKLLYKKIKENIPKYKEPNYEDWANTFRLMMEMDELPGKEIQDMILWVSKHHFWYRNILSPKKLREKFPQLDAQKNERDNVAQFKAPKAGESPNLNYWTEEDKEAEEEIDRRIAENEAKKERKGI